MYKVLNELFENFTDSILLKKRNENGFTVTYRDENGVIEYGRDCDLYRAYALLDGALKEGCDSFNLSETPKFDTLGVMIDVSRGAVLKVETVKDVMRTIAKMGYNRMMLYTEDTFLVDTYPYFGYMRGAYTEEELMEIVS